jgi:hypothetical protein
MLEGAQRAASKIGIQNFLVNVFFGISPAAPAILDWTDHRGVCLTLGFFHSGVLHVQR